MSNRRASLLLVATVVATLALGIPLGVALASHQFSDVPSNSPYHGDIDALVDTGVTSGCGGGKYCPKDAVTREQMAAFLNRLGALGPGKTPVANADKVDGLDASAFERSSAILSGTVDYGTLDARVVLDPRTGADVRNRATYGVNYIRIINTDATRRLVISGTSIWGGIGPQPESANLAPGEEGMFNTDTLPSTYLDLVLTLSGETAAQTRVSRLTCSMADAGGGVPAWLSCVLVG